MTDIVTAGGTQHHLRRSLAIAAGTTLLSATTFVGTAAGQDAIGCGDVITEDTTLAADIGPCPGDGLIVEADGVTLDLGGHTITGDPNARRAPDKAGILLYRVSGVTVTNGTVANFDGGVVVRGGAENTIRKVTASDNVNYRVLTGRDSTLDDIDRETGPFCDYGDGIAVFNSSGNSVEQNNVTGNGPYGGISLIEDSDDNVVAKNKILDNDVLNANPDGEITVCGGPPGNMSEGRLSMTIGVKIEGPGSDRNVVEGNQVRNASMAGVGVVGQLTDGPQSSDNVVRNNRISDTARSTQGDPEKEGRAHSHGIALMRSSASPSAEGTLIEGNNSSRNLGNGVYLDSRETLSGTTVRGNVVNNNGLDGIGVEGPGDPDGPSNVLTGNRGHGNGDRAEQVNEEYRFAGHGGVDGYDPTGCDGFDWSRNRFGSVNHECVATDGTGRVGGPGRSGDAPGGR
ncbi:MAG: hypothetical protein GEU83_07025 [Pseudonocardiaceae bacterium]|nr:hypothetical protein [Pseudonocardiaceae bacterium]